MVVVFIILKEPDRSPSGLECCCDGDSHTCLTATNQTDAVLDGRVLAFCTTVCCVLVCLQGRVCWLYLLLVIESLQTCFC